MSKPIFSCVSYNFNDYELFYELPETAMNPDVEYLYFTNNKSLTSSTWTMVYMDSDEDPFYSVCNLRYHIFDHINSDIAILFDGSMRLQKDLKPIVDRFNEGNYDFASIIHPTRNTIYDELSAWVQQRGMDVNNANNMLNFMHNNGYDVMNYKGLWQINFMMLRRTDMIINMLKNTMDICLHFPEEGKKVFRCDQVVISFVINTHFSNMKIMPVGQYICFDHYFNWCTHGTNTPMVYNCAYDCDPFIFDKRVTIWYI